MVMHTAAAEEADSGETAGVRRRGCGGGFGAGGAGEEGARNDAGEI